MTAGDECRDTGDTDGARAVPVGIDRFAVTPLLERIAGLLGVQADALDDIDQDLDVADVLHRHEIGPVKRVMQGVAALLRIRPNAEFLRQTAVVGVCPLAIGKPFGVHQAFHALIHGIDVDTAAGEELLQRLPFGRRLGVQREMNPLHLDVERLFQFLNTPGAEVAPRSNVVREDLQDYRLGHRGSPFDARVFTGRRLWEGRPKGTQLRGFGKRGTVGEQPVYLVRGEARLRSAAWRARPTARPGFLAALIGGYKEQSGQMGEVRIMSKLYYEDIEVGEILTGDAVEVDRDTMIAFARLYDNQPMHVDGEAARAMGFDDVIASSAFTFSLMMKSVNPVMERIHFLPSGLDITMHFRRPVYGGDRLIFEAKVSGKRESRKPERGILTMKNSFPDQNGASVLDTDDVWLIRRRAG